MNKNQLEVANKIAARLKTLSQHVKDDRCPMPSTDLLLSEWTAVCIASAEEEHDFN